MHVSFRSSGTVSCAHTVSTLLEFGIRGFECGDDRKTGIQNPSMFVRRRCAYDARLPYSFTEFNRVLNSNMFDSDASVSILAQSVGVFDRDPCAPRVAAVPCPISCTQYLCLFVLLEDELQDCPCACIERLFVCALDPKFFDTHLPHSFTALLLSSVCETMSSLPND